MSKILDTNMIRGEDGKYVCYQCGNDSFSQYMHMDFKDRYYDEYICNKCGAHNGVARSRYENANI